MGKRSLSSAKKLPVPAHFEGDGMLVCLELLSSVYGETEIVPVPMASEMHQNSEADDYLTQKYKDQVCPLLLEVEGEIIFPLVGMFDSDMFILNYRQFYL